MISQLGLVSPGVPGLSVLTDPGEARTDARTDGAVGTTVALDRSVFGPERGDTARAIDPAPATERAKAAGAETAAEQKKSILPPDPDAPAGPPPAFEASILDRAREQASAPPPLYPEVPSPLEARAQASATTPGANAGVATADTGTAPREEPTRATAEATARPYDVPPSAENRAERDVATLRRMETPYDTGTVDVSR